MTEIELKFQVPAIHRVALGRAVGTSTSSRMQLRAQYYDTAQRHLAHAGLALRVRKEGRRWVQTLKGAGDGIWQRLEHEVALAVPAVALPVADPALHDGTEAGAALRRALGEGLLLPAYATEVTRIKRMVRAKGCLVELAFDQGALKAGARRWPLCELEFELKGGDPGALAALAARWVQRFGLTLDTRTKAERGDRLARGVRVGVPVKAGALLLTQAVDSHVALRAVVGNCLAQVLGNAGEIAHEDDTSPEHLHQLRVGLRRLRTALRELGALSPQVGSGWADALAQLFGRLGLARDHDALAQTLLPALHKAGACGLALPTIEAEPVVQRALRDAATTRLWLELVAFAAGTGLSGVPFAPVLQARLERLFRQVRRDARQFATLDDEARHRLRKRVKRLRYLSDFGAGLHRPREVRAFHKQLTPVQDALGAFNDVCVARSLFEPEGLQHPLAKFALGWLAHEHDDCIERSLRALAPLRKAKPYW